MPNIIPFVHPLIFKHSLSPHARTSAIAGISGPTDGFTKEQRRQSLLDIVNKATSDRLIVNGCNGGVDGEPVVLCEGAMDSP